MVIKISDIGVQKGERDYSGRIYGKVSFVHLIQRHDEYQGVHAGI